jgi:hypothetical protein
MSATLRCKIDCDQLHPWVQMQDTRLLHNDFDLCITLLLTVYHIRVSGRERAWLQLGFLASRFCKQQQSSFGGPCSLVATPSSTKARQLVTSAVPLPILPCFLSHDSNKQSSCRTAQRFHSCTPAGLYVCVKLPLCTQRTGQACCKYYGLAESIDH